MLNLSARYLEIHDNQYDVLSHGGIDCDIGYHLRFLPAHVLDPRDMSILETYTKPMATDRNKRHARVKDSSGPVPVSSRETKYAPTEIEIEIENAEIDFSNRK